MDLHTQAIAALASIQALPPHERAALMTIKHSVNTGVLTRNLLAFFEAAMISNDGVPNFTMQEFTDSLADALVKLGKNRELGHAVVQTLVYELQERVNDQV